MDQRSQLRPDSVKLLRKCGEDRSTYRQRYGRPEKDSRAQEIRSEIDK